MRKINKLPNKTGTYKVKFISLLPPINVNVIKENASSNELCARFGKLNFKLEAVFKDSSWENCTN